MIKQYVILTLSALFSTICIAQVNQKDENGERHGYWKVDFGTSDQPKFEGQYIHGKQSGIFKYYKKGFYEHPAAIMDFSESSDSVDVIYFTQSGNKISEGKMLNKKREGVWIYFHKDSDSIMMQETYKNDLLHGIQKTYFPNGQLAEKTNYENGEKNGPGFIYADNGQVTKELNYKNGQLHGPAIYYTVKGELSIEGHYTDGKKSGIWKYYSDGKLEEEIEY